MQCPTECGFIGSRTEVAKHLDEVHKLLLCSSFKCSTTFSGPQRKRSRDEHVRTKHLKKGYRCSVCGEWKRYRNYIYKHGCVNAKALQDTAGSISSTVETDENVEVDAMQSEKSRLRKRPAQSIAHKVGNEGEMRDDSSFKLVNKSVESRSQREDIKRQRFMENRKVVSAPFRLSSASLAQHIQDAINAKLRNLDIEGIRRIFHPSNVENLAQTIHDGIKSKVLSTQSDEETLQWIIHAIKIFNIRSKIAITADNTAKVQMVDKCVGTSDGDLQNKRKKCVPSDSSDSSAGKF